MRSGGNRTKDFSLPAVTTFLELDPMLYVQPGNTVTKCNA